FPAIQVFYETDDGVSCVHTNQRIFNNIEDEIANQNLNGLQTGFDVYLDDTNFSFLTFINGPVELKNRKLEIFFYNHNGEEFKYKKFYKKINGYQTIFIDFRNCDGLKEFLGGKSGFCKVLSPTKHSFNRILAGTLGLGLLLYIFVNIGMVIGIIPVVGAPLPLLSFGGTYIASLMIGFGILMSINAHKKRMA
ncbi:FtsW/RodA/SpoVE family cell cycle protein, partial [uncultured Christiangramia sp.]|uniref:FtsW/RodA/SpoVE family cell cycle protein n=1 Tax=uncultured Christiangramia sp. TaxID=503836 RepID=UPI0025F53BFD